MNFWKLPPHLLSNLVVILNGLCNLSSSGCPWSEATDCQTTYTAAADKHILKKILEGPEMCTANAGHMKLDSYH